MAKIRDNKMICPHCQTQGSENKKKGKRKGSISGGKVIGGLLTGGISLFATGLSRKNKVTEAYCVNCGTTWIINR